MSFQTDLFDSIVNNVYVLTGRPDLEDETALAVRTATASAHHTDFYNRDHVTQLVQLPNGSTGAYAVGLDISNLFPRFRAVNWIRPTDVSNQVLTSEDNDIEIVEIGDFRTPEGRNRTNYGYVAGSTLNILTNVAVYGFLIGWWSSPNTNREQYNSWMAQLYDPAIIYWAAAIVLNTNGNEEKANKYMKMVNELYIPHLKSNYLVGKGN